MSVAPFTRTLDQELAAIVRGASLECPVCGEFLLRLEGVIACPECRSLLVEGCEVPEVALPALARAAAVRASPAG
ncbi:MAG TPA: hypothetical protein VNJ53_08765 [Gaiellaceae bacterium]|nr:hypothetical protein [Gaiellaceae bacterium]